jgi:plastocyanin
MNRSLVVIVIPILIGILAVVAWINRPMDDSNTSTSQQTTAQPAPTPAPQQASSQPDTAKSVVIIYDNNGFNPSSATIKSGQVVTFQNKSSSTIQPSSDPHPQHTDNPELNVGMVAAGQSKSITPTKTGSFGMHDHFKPGNTFTITVQ